LITTIALEHNGEGPPRNVPAKLVLSSALYVFLPIVGHMAEAPIFRQYSVTPRYLARFSPIVVPSMVIGRFRSDHDAAKRAITMAVTRN
jgi:hypothetical protein